MTLAQRFLNAYSRIEKYFASQNKSGKHFSFQNSVNFQAKHNEIIRRFRDDLIEYGQLRNAIVHDRANETEIIAEPHEEVVIKIERIANLLTKPKTVNDLEFKKVLTCRRDDLFSKVLQKMNEMGYSQVPVLNGKRVINVLSSSMIVHYMYQHIEANMINLDGIIVNDVLEDRDEHYQLVQETTPLLKIIELFGESSQKGQVLSTVVVVDKESVPVGILTPKDIPYLLNEMIND